MQHYVASRPMFIDVEVMNTDIQVVLGDQGLQAGTTNIARGLSTLYKEITGAHSFCFLNFRRGFYIDIPAKLSIDRGTVQ